MFLLVMKDTDPPTINNEARLITELIVIAKSPVSSMYGIRGIMAPMMKHVKELILAPQGDPSDIGFKPNVSLIIVSRATSLFSIIRCDISWASC